MRFLPAGKVFCRCAARLLPSPQPSLALRASNACPTGRRGRLVANVTAVVALLLLIGEPRASASTDRLPPPVGEGWGGGRESFFCRRAKAHPMVMDCINACGKWSLRGVSTPPTLLLSVGWVRPQAVTQRSPLGNARAALTQPTADWRFGREAHFMAMDLYIHLSAPGVCKWRGLGVRWRFIFPPLNARQLSSVRRRRAPLPCGRCASL